LPGNLVEANLAGIIPINVKFLSIVSLLNNTINPTT
jgi:hypothetical protein